MQDFLSTVAPLSVETAENRLAEHLWMPTLKTDELVEANELLRVVTEPLEYLCLFHLTEAVLCRG